MPTYLLNEIPNIKEKSYLELGIFNGDHFRTVNAKTKTSVDLNHPADYVMTTDDYFKQLDPSVKFDLVYIDADHDCRSVQKDFNNCLDHLSSTGSIFLHDLYPENENLTRPEYCDNAFIFLDSAIKTGYKNIFTLDADYGVTLFYRPCDKILKLQLETTYLEFRKTTIDYRLYNKEEMIQIVKGLPWD